MAKFITNPFAPIPKHPKSHVRGWSDYWSRMLNAEIYRGDFSDLSSSDQLFIDHGVNFSGTLNLFGGLTDSVATKLKNLSTVNPKVCSLDITMPNYCEMLATRVGKSSTSSIFTFDVVSDLELIFSTSSKFKTYGNLNKSWLTIGDSHATAFARAESSVCRINGQTLHGFLYNNKIEDIVIPKNIKGVTFVLGSIDIRHHAMRQSNPYKTHLKLVQDYILFLEDFQDLYNVEVEVAAPVPIEYEGRKLPKTGYYEGTPFYGKLLQRRRLTSDTIKALQDSKIDVVMPPVEWYLMDPEKYANDYMEFGGSVHLAPTYYRCQGVWDV